MKGAKSRAVTTDADVVAAAAAAAIGNAMARAGMPDPINPGNTRNKNSQARNSSLRPRRPNPRSRMPLPIWIPRLMSAQRRPTCRLTCRLQRPLKRKRPGGVRLFASLRPRLEPTRPELIRLELKLPRIIPRQQHRRRRSR
jgi:hypothetical protein